MKRTPYLRVTKAFMLLEALFGMMLVSSSVVLLLAAIQASWMFVRLHRDNLAATQVLLSRYEAIRMTDRDDMVSHTWTQSVNGLTFNGTVTVGASGISSSYSNDLKGVTIKVDWQSGLLPRTRQWTTFVAKEGLYRFIY